MNEYLANAKKKRKEKKKRYLIRGVMPDGIAHPRS